MTTHLAPTAFASSFPRVSALMGERNIAERIRELEWMKPLKEMRRVR